MQQDAPHHLAIVRGEALGGPSAQTAQLPFLSAQPFRPGEMPTPVPLGLTIARKRRLAARANRVRIPLGLWTRCAIECSRHVSEVAPQVGLSAPELTRQLDELAASWRDKPVTAACVRRQIQYARAVRQGDPSAPFEDSTSPVVAMLPDMMLAGWTQAASATGSALDSWAEQQLKLMPEHPHLWEATAAEAGRSLGEWIYTTTLARIRRR
jgi:hypothetical protein